MVVLYGQFMMHGQRNIKLSGVSVSVGKAIAAEKLLTSIKISRSYKSALTQAWDLLVVRLSQHRDKLTFALCIPVIVFM